MGWMKKRVATFGWLLASAFTSLIGSAAAAEYCVGDVAELQSATAQPSYSGNALFTTVVSIKQGTHPVGNTLDNFSSAQADSGFPRGEGDLFHKSFRRVPISNAHAGQNGNGSFSVLFPSSVSLNGHAITLTAAYASGNTSERCAPPSYVCDVMLRHGIDDAIGDQGPP
ncbi:MAG: hypothetical protein ABIQ70_03440 [Dokdonella sp.]